MNPPNRDDSDTWTRLLIAFGLLFLGSLVLVLSGFLSWFLRDGLGPDANESSGPEAFLRFFSNFWPGLVLGLALSLSGFFLIRWRVKPWRKVEKADERFKDWCADSGFPIHVVEHVATFEDWDDAMGVYVFFPNDADLNRARREGFVDRAKAGYLTMLRQARFPLKRFPDISFDFDSHENVVRNFKGNYFLRLR